MTDSQLQANKDVVANFMNTIVNDGDPVKAAELYMADEYIQHEHAVPDGKAAFLKNMEENFNAEGMSLHIKRMIAEDDLVSVLFHLKLSPDAPGMAALDIFRVTDAKVSEHWTVHMPAPTNEDGTVDENVF